MIITGLSGIAIFGAVALISSKRPIYSILALIVTLYSIGGIYLLMQAQFLSISHLIVYAGAIMVLFLFVIMLMNLDFPEKLDRSRLVRLSGGLASAVLGSIVVVSVTGLPGTMAPHSDSSAEALGRLIFTRFAATFEFSIILFLAAIIGVIVVAGEIRK